MTWTFIAVFCVLLVLPIYVLFKTRARQPINGIYRQRDAWSLVKFWAFYVLFNLRQYQNKKKSTVSGENAGYGMRSRSNIAEMEQPQPLPQEHPKAVDAVYFNGANKEGYYFVGATARRHEKLIQTLLYIRVPGLGLLELPSLPDTSLYREDELTYSTGGFKIQPVQPMKKWKLLYDGKMRLVEEGKKEGREVQVRFRLDWIAGPGYFDFDTDLHPYALCEAMCREKWTRDFFEQLRVAHQTHYEQFGEISGKIHIGDERQIDLNVHGVRDHSYGNIRDWKMLHRYCIQYLTLEDGTSICAGLICMPSTLSRLPIGYVCHKDGRIDALEWIDFEFFHSTSGDDGNPPNQFNFSFKAGSTIYKLKGQVLDAPVFYMGYEWEARIHERMCSYTVNGIHGWGISEWDYRNHTGRPNKYNKKDIAKRKE